MIDVFDTYQYANCSLEDLGLPAPDTGCVDSKKFFLGAVGSCLTDEAGMTTLTTKIRQNAKLRGTALFELANQYLEAAGRRNQCEINMKRMSLLLHLDLTVGSRFPSTCEYIPRCALPSSTSVLLI